MPDKKGKYLHVQVPSGLKKDFDLMAISLDRKQNAMLKRIIEGALEVYAEEGERFFAAYQPNADPAGPWVHVRIPAPLKKQFDLMRRQLDLSQTQLITYIITRALDEHRRQGGN